jgi:1,4-dihydroxy-2-naphthoate octaprenyltransferase
MIFRRKRSKAPRSVVSDYEKKIDAYQKNVERYDKEKDEIKKKAEELEVKREEARKHSRAFGLAAMFLQIAILLSSIAALMKQKYFWFLGMLTGTIGILYFFNGFFLFMK